MSTLVAEPILGLEAIQREAFLVLHDNLNSNLQAVNNFMGPRDEGLAVHLGIPYVENVMEPIASTNFYEGHRPSLIKAPVDMYPNCSVWAVRVSPTPENALLDQISVHRTLLYIELMVKSATDEGEANRRLLRTVEAANICIMSNPTLNGLVNEQDGDPTVSVSEVFLRKERTSYGPQWFWQGARLEYAVRKEAATPNSSSGSIFTADSAPGIDYSQFIDQP